MTDSQLKIVNNLSATSDSVLVTPAVIFEELSEIRVERGLFYAASLSSADARYKEINFLAEGKIADQKIIKNANIYVNVLNSYLRALKSISSDVRWKGIGTEFRGIGNNIDSVFIKYNALDWSEEDISVGIAKLSGRYLGYFTQSYMRIRQAKLVKDFVATGDTIVSGCTDALIKALKRDKMTELIQNEEEGLKLNYLAYLERLEASETIPDIDIDRHYIELMQKISKTKDTRNKCISALKSLKKAHHKLMVELEKRKKIEFIYEEILELNTLSAQLNTLVKELQSDEKN
ncbi:MAG: hypothetical protein WCR82_03955 [Bacteroidales bacterium]